MLRGSGLHAQEQKSVLAAAGAQWRSDRIEEALLMMHGGEQLKEPQQQPFHRTWHAPSKGGKYGGGKGKDKAYRAYVPELESEPEADLCIPHITSTVAQKYYVKGQP
eukprot:6490920-Amphidinium_carterae.5